MPRGNPPARLPDRRPDGRQEPRRGSGSGRPRPPRRAQPSRWRSPQVFVAATIAIIAVLVVVAVVAGRSGGGTSGTTPAPSASPVPQDVLAAVTAVPVATLDAIGDGGVPDPMHALTGAPPLRHADGRPQVFYAGGEFCPFCAAERWSMVVALSRFGTFSGLGLTTSSSTDVYPDTATFTFTHSSYTSTAVSFDPIELEDREQNTLATPNPSQAALIAAYDVPPYTSRAGAVPFVDVAGRWVTAASPDPQLLAGKDWRAVANALSNAQDPATRALLGTANWLTAALCSAAGDRSPSSVCADPVITALVNRLPR